MCRTYKTFIYDVFMSNTFICVVHLFDLMHICWFYVKCRVFCTCNNILNSYVWPNSCNTYVALFIFFISPLLDYNIPHWIQADFYHTVHTGPRANPSHWASFFGLGIFNKVVRELYSCVCQVNYVPERFRMDWNKMIRYFPMVHAYTLTYIFLWDRQA